MSDFKAKMHQIRFSLGSAPDPAYSAPPGPLAVFKGRTSKGRDGEGKGRGGKGSDGKGKGRGGGGRKGRGGREGNEGVHLTHFPF